jgi:maltose alpha-D-glucosyltransferase / alpha-amylase
MEGNPMGNAGQPGEVQLPGLSAEIVNRLERFLGEQRWFAGKARKIEETRILVAVPMAEFTITLVNVSYTDGVEETYFVPIVTNGGELADALGAEPFCRHLFAIIEHAEVINTQQGTLRGIALPLFSSLCGAQGAIEPIRVVAHDQSNSAIVFGDRLFLKIFRKVEPGLNPDYEVARYLTQQGVFTRLPRVAGAVEFQPPVGSPLTLATLLEWVPNDGSAWDAMLLDVKNAFAQGAARANERIELLGRRTAELHLALSSATEDPAFAPQPLTIDDCESLAARLRRNAELVFHTLAHTSTVFEPKTAAAVRELLVVGPALVDQFSSLLAIDPGCTKTRVHGDYHLGQVLCQGDDFVILDFEGEPARSLAERRAKDSPLRDVAGMLRSFGYAAYAALFQFTEKAPEELSRLEPIAKAWQQVASAAYLRGYFDVTRDASFLPPTRTALKPLLDFFIVEKALYELQYELNNRPAWLRIPLAGILEIAHGSGRQD